MGQLLEQLIAQLRSGFKRVEARHEGKRIAAYWVGSVIRIDIYEEITFGAKTLGGRLV